MAYTFHCPSLHPQACMQMLKWPFLKCSLLTCMTRLLHSCPFFFCAKSGTLSSVCEKSSVWHHQLFIAVQHLAKSSVPLPFLRASGFGPSGRNNPHYFLTNQTLRSRSREAKNRFGGLVEVSFLTLMGQVA